MAGWLKIIGLGAGNPQLLTPQACAALHAASDIVGYETYVNMVPAGVQAKRHASDNGVEVERSEYALELADGGAKVAVVSGGDAGVFGMAAAVLEAVAQNPARWGGLDIEVVPGITALLAAAARIGAPLGHDFCVVSLSDYLKPWEIIKKRLIAASEGDFVLAIYNPASKTRREQLKDAIDILTGLRGGETIAIIATNVSRQREKITITSLDKINPELVTMQSLLIIGSSHTRLIERGKGADPWVFTPRFYKPIP